VPSRDSEDEPKLCTCMGDGLAALPPELRPRPQRKGSLRKVTCPGCGLAYWTNRDTDLCIECEKREGPDSVDGKST